METVTPSDFTAEAQGYSAKTPNTNYYYYGFISVFSGKYFGNVTFDAALIDRPGHTANIEAGGSRDNHTVGGAIGGIVLPKQNNDGVTVTIENVIVNGSIHAYNRGGGVIGYIGGYNGSNNLTNSQMNGTVNIINCINNANITTDATTTFGTIGGILGTTNQRQAGAVINFSGCINNGNLEGVRVGGMVGDVHASDYQGEDGGTINITGCKNTGEVAVIRVQADSYENAWNAAGGIFGFAQSYNYTLEIADCINEGNVVDKSGWTAGRVYLGGIIGGGDETNDIGLTMTNNQCATVTADNNAVNNKLEGIYIAGTDKFATEYLGIQIH